MQHAYDSLKGKRFKFVLSKEGRPLRLFSGIRRKRIRESQWR